MDANNREVIPLALAADAAAYDVCRARTSVRSYFDEPIPEESVATLKEYVKAVNGEPCPFDVKGKYVLDEKKLGAMSSFGVISGPPPAWIVGIIDKEKKTAGESFGYDMHKILLHATRLNLGTIWLGGTFRLKPFQELYDSQKEKIICVSPVGKPSGKKTMMEKGMHYLLAQKPTKRMPWKDLFFVGDFAHPLANPEDAGEFQHSFEAVRMAPSARNQQGWRIVWDKEGRMFHFFSFSKSGHEGTGGMDDMVRVDIGIGMAQWEFVAKEENGVGKWVREDPKVAVPQGEEKKLRFVATWQFL